MKTIYQERDESNKPTQAKPKIKIVRENSAKNRVTNRLKNSPKKPFKFKIPKMNFDFTGLGSDSIPKPRPRISKLGLGLAGVVTLGAIGYGVARKIRSDKGRRRR